MAHTKAGGTTKLGRDSQPKFLGVKKYAGESVKTGEILIRQRGSRFAAGENVMTGSDYTLYAGSPGTVRFREKSKTRFDGTKRRIKVVSVVPH
ncbi:MAG: 50S ribosomal protein L27 [Candidatus Sungbacteria bacterium RIFCSPLOWO2_01_FULL_47_10]|uniref:Large ribosomal subunit protein bL27 n=1 Tax=Candidatus Sungbacteria bacterium RIFCSPLOWO2_01_FULL_47_10 TaxID=1802276 RepID=A0A1G2L1R2_9BACT|nr:MAG: 50S ribosomal protein L27 [Candidatus Sungbacteria bacterium RIFCSPLOWO2_01_FULL_47_10]